MTELSKNSTVEHTQALLIRYGFDLDGYEAVQLATQWAHHYQIRWICSAVVEALYQGRYKAISVEQILLFWERRGEPICHFNRDFERIIRGHSASGLATKPDTQPLLPSPQDAGIEPEASAATAPDASAGSSSAGWFTHPPFSTSAIPEPPLLQLAGADSSEPEESEPGEIQETISPVPTPLSRPASPHSDLPIIPSDSLHPAADLTSHPAESFQHVPETGIDDTEPVTPLVMPSANDAPNLSASEPALIPESAVISEPTIVSSTESKFPTRAFRLPSKPIRAEVYQANWSRCQVSKRPIGRFVPASEASEFYTKLKAVAQKVGSPESGLG